MINGEHFITVLSVRVLETRNIIANQIFPDRSIEQESNSEDSIELPRGALLENSEGGLVRIVFVAFDRLESILRPLDSGIEPKSYDSVSNEDTIGKATSALFLSLNLNHKNNFPTFSFCFKIQMEKNGFQCG